MTCFCMQYIIIYIYAGFAHGTKNDDAFDGNNNTRVRETTWKIGHLNKLLKFNHIDIEIELIL